MNTKLLIIERVQGTIYESEINLGEQYTVHKLMHFDHFVQAFSEKFLRIYRCRTFLKSFLVWNGDTWKHWSAPKPQINVFSTLHPPDIRHIFMH